MNRAAPVGHGFDGSIDGRPRAVPGFIGQEGKGEISAIRPDDAGEGTDVRAVDQNQILDFPREVMKG